MRRTDTVIIGGGQAGLAMSHCLGAWGIDHVVLERGRVGERWRSERWDSLRLLTPSWQSRLPGWRYRGPDPDGYMTMPEVIDYLDGYAATLPVPVEEHTTVVSVAANTGGYRVVTDRGTWQTRTVVIATGQCDVPLVPGFAAALPAGVEQVVPSDYRRPAQLPDGGVLVVGASATGIQLADEIHRSGRPVTLAVGRHIRLPRTYRGRDIMWWLDAIGAFDETADRVRDLARSRSQPSLQLIGREDRASLDLGSLHAAGVRLAGRALGVSGRQVRFAGDLAATTGRADAKLARIVDRIERFAARWGLDRVLPPPHPAPVIAPPPSPEAIDLDDENIRSVVWATGFRRRYPWLDVPVLDERGELRHDGGITPAPGLFVLGLYFMRRRNSSFLDGVGHDARFLAAQIAARVSHCQAVAA